MSGTALRCPAGRIRRAGCSHPLSICPLCARFRIIASTSAQLLCCCCCFMFASARVTAPLRFSAPEIRAPGRRPGRSRWRARGDRSRARARVRTARARAARARAARARTGPRRAARARVARARASATPSRATRWPARGFFTAELAALASAGAGRIPAAPSRTCSRWARA